MLDDRVAGQIEQAERRNLAEIRDAIDLLEIALDRFTVKIGRPLFIPEADRPRYRYPKATSLILQVLKAVRVVSGLNALVVCLQHGYTQDMGVILRTVHEFLGDIFFLHEAHVTGKPTADQKRLMELFFADDIRTTEEMLRQEKEPARVPRKSVRASAARMLQPRNPDRVIRIAKAIDETYSRYVHGAYPAIMELWDDHAGKFRVRGMLGTPKIGVFRVALAQVVHRALNEFAVIAHSMRMEDLRTALIEKRKSFEKSAAYRS